MIQTFCQEFFENYYKKLLPLYYLSVFFSSKMRTRSIEPDLKHTISAAENCFNLHLRKSGYDLTSASSKLEQHERSFFRVIYFCAGAYNPSVPGCAVVIAKVTDKGAGCGKDRKPESGRHYSYGRHSCIASRREGVKGCALFSVKFR